MTHRTGELTPFREEKRGNCKIGRFKIGRCKTYLSFFFVRLVPKVQDIKIKRYRFLTDLLPIRTAEPTEPEAAPAPQNSNLCIFGIYGYVAHGR